MKMHSVPPDISPSFHRLISACAGLNVKQKLKNMLDISIIGNSSYKHGTGFSDAVQLV